MTFFCQYFKAMFLNILWTDKPLHDSATLRLTPFFVFNLIIYRRKLNNKNKYN